MNLLIMIKVTFYAALFIFLNAYDNSRKWGNSKNQYHGNELLLCILWFTLVHWYQILWLCFYPLALVVHCFINDSQQLLK